MLEKIDGETGNLIQTFDSVSEFVEFSDKHATDARSGRKNDWHGNVTFAESVDMSHIGWKEGAVKALAIETRLASKATSILAQQSPFMSTEGLEIDMGAYCSGQPECWVDTVPEYLPANGNVVKVVANLAASSGVGPEQMIARGCALSALCAALETSGRGCEVWGAFPLEETWSGKGRTVTAMIKVKAAGQPMDLGRLAYAMAHPSFLRQVGFGWLDHVQSKGYAVGKADCYGIPGAMPDSCLGDVGNPPMLYGGDDRFGRDARAALDWIKDVLKKQGVEIDS